MMITGTAHFVSKKSALKYYKVQAACNMEDIEKYIKEGEIHIGKPQKKENTEIEISRDGRYLEVTK